MRDIYSEREPINTTHEDETTKRVSLAWNNCAGSLDKNSVNSANSASRSLPGLAGQKAGTLIAR